MKGIVLAGGSGSRLYPLTLVTSKQLLPVYDKPLIYYSLSVLMMAGIKDILIITTNEDMPNFRNLLGDGGMFGISLSYIVQEKPEGLSQAFILGEEFLGDDSCVMILGDNIFYGAKLIKHLKSAVERANNGISTIFGYFVKDPERYGIVEFDDNKVPLNIIEKPKNSPSNYCITGLYFYPAGVSNLAKKVTKSERGEYEISTLNNMYIKMKKTHLELLGRGYSWLDAGTHESLADASNYIKILEEHQGIKVCCPEEIAFSNGWISKDKLIEIGNSMKNNQYGQHLLNVAGGKIKY